MAVLKIKAAGSIFQVGGPGTPQPTGAALVGAANTFTADQTFTGKILPLGSGVSSVRVGDIASASVSGAAAIGIGAAVIASAADAIAIGASSQATQSQAIAIGKDSLATGGTRVVALGRFAQATAAAATALGGAAQALAASSVAVGDSAVVILGETGGVAIGVGATCDPTVSGVPGGENIAAGRLAFAGAWRSTALGYKARAEVVSSTALGRGAIASLPHSVAIGRGSFTPASGTGTQVAIGWSGDNSATDVYFECGHTHKYLNPIDGDTINRTPSLIPIVIHGFDAFDRTGGVTDDNVAGGPLVLAAGRGTGTAAGGAVKLQAAPAGGVSNNTKNALVTRLEADATGLGFFGTTPIAKPTGVAVSAAGIHAALVSLGLIAA